MGPLWKVMASVTATAFAVPTCQKYGSQSMTAGWRPLVTRTLGRKSPWMTCCSLAIGVSRSTS